MIILKFWLKMLKMMMFLLLDVEVVMNM